MLARLAACAALAAAVPVRADSGDTLVDHINAYRANPGSCEGRQARQAVPLTPHAALAQVQIGPGTFLELALEKAGYLAERAEAIYLSGAPDAASAMAAMRQPYCRTLLNAQFTAVGATRNGDQWQIVLAQPLLPPALPDWPQAGQTILQAVNVARASPRTCGERHFAAAPALAWNPALGDAALAHSRDMARQKYFDHQGKDGKAVGDRAHQAGYRWRRIGENIASGVRSPEEAVAGWIASPGHCANIMNRDFTEMGAAYAIRHDRRIGRIYWTQVFGTPR